MSKALLGIAKNAALAAAEILRDGFHNRNSIKVETKGINDYVSNIDKASEEAILAVIKRAYPEDFIVAEETASAYTPSKYKVAGKHTWIIDPLDGTRNFIMGNPHFAVSIAVQENGETVAAVVFNPITDELFTAVKGAGAFLNNRRLRLEPHAKGSGIKGKVITTGYAFKEPQRLARQLEVLPLLFNQGMGDIRRLGAAALDLCYVAAGRFDGFYEEGIKPWDIAAGDLIAREANAMVIDFQGGNRYLETDEVIAGNVEVAREIAKIIHSVSRVQAATNPQA
ncbi:inositol monophosphatase family protein [Psittacicella gerlachiana]|uniref:Inositol-1-monophosphatase n=1 Tax=Psittacicella gerlachiana TaxID=2028574 RepID=A0A3A1YEN2_9GAMM|nr:inositol monophosphatase family protein [Psittacicella gerlachiana]RIY35600.1 hypothetical protein CKF59_03385 [Psittacicella gerlachiana]